MLHWLSPHGFSQAQNALQNTVFGQGCTLDRAGELIKLPYSLYGLGGDIPPCWCHWFHVMLQLDGRITSFCVFIYHFWHFADRYRSLPSANHRLQFAYLQLELLEDFRVRLLQVRKEMIDNEQSPVTAQMCSILNTVSYIEGILQQWNNLPVRSAYS